MNRSLSIRKRLLLHITVSLALTGGILLFTADSLIRSIVDEEHRKLYFSKLDIIRKELEAAHRRLEATLAPERYRADIQTRFLKNFYSVYYGKGVQDREYPVITDYRGRGIAHPRFKPADHRPNALATPFSRKQQQYIINNDQGFLSYRYHDRKKWAAFIRFRPWRWIVFFSVPMETKYREANRIRLILFCIFIAMALITGTFYLKTSSRFTLRIEILDRTALNITSGNLNTPVEYLGTDELGRLASNLESMRRSILNQFRELDDRNRTLREEILHRKAAEQQVRDSLGEKEALLKEIHHRVKNNLQTISSLLRLQMDRMESEIAKTALSDSVNRVHSMALVHEQLYRSDNLSEIEMGGLIDKLASGTDRIMSNRRIGISIQCEPLYLKIKQAIPCALIINELLTNAIKHAFPGGEYEKPEISISLSRHNGSNIEMIISDNGCGIPDTVDRKSSSTLGLNLVHLLSEQLSGNLAISAEAGTRFTLTFPLE